MFEMYRKSYGASTKDVVVCKAPGWILNPVYWTKSRCEELKERDPAAYETDCAAEFADKILSFLSSEHINAAIRNGKFKEEYMDGMEYVAAMDPATRGNAWTLGIGGLSPTGVKRLAYARQWQGSAAEPLSPELVFEDMVQCLRDYRVDKLYTDQWSFDALADIAAKHGVRLMAVQSSTQGSVHWFTSLRNDLIDRKVTLLDLPDMAPDLKRVQRKVTQNGVSIHLPRTNDGRHCDYASMLALLFSRYFPEAMLDSHAPRAGSVERDIEQLLLEQQEARRWADDL
jgi:hypothetical protein